MMAKLDNPGRVKEAAYNNTGSVARLKNYLVANQDKIDSKDLFFNSTQNNISPERFFTMIDKNVLKLEKNDHKFYSFTLNPSSDELAFIGNDKEKLKEYTRDAIDRLAMCHENLKDSKELVWGAIIHEGRTYTAEELGYFKSKNKVDPDWKVGQLKPGNNAHVHVVISAMNKDQTKKIPILTVQNKISRKFDLRRFQKESQVLFQEKFFYKNGVNIYGERQAAIIGDKIQRLDRRFYRSYNVEDIMKMGEKMGWTKQFNTNLNTMIRETYGGKLILYPDQYLINGPKAYNENFPNGKANIDKVSTSGGGGADFNTEAQQKQNEYMQDKVFDQLSGIFEWQGKVQERKGYDRPKNSKFMRRRGRGI